jgi:hypothetical protein
MLLYSGLSDADERKLMAILLGALIVAVAFPIVGIILIMKGKKGWPIVGALMLTIGLGLVSFLLTRIG